MGVSPNRRKFRQRRLSGFRWLALTSRLACKPHQAWSWCHNFPYLTQNTESPPQHGQFLCDMTSKQGRRNFRRFGLTPPAWLGTAPAARDPAAHAAPCQTPSYVSIEASTSFLSGQDAGITARRVRISTPGKAHTKPTRAEGDRTGHGCSPSLAGYGIHTSHLTTGLTDAR